MSHGHGHGHALEGGPRWVGSERRSRWVLLGALALTAIATLLGTFWLWPDADDAPDGVAYAAEGVTFVDAQVLEVGEPCPVVRVDPAAPQGEGQGQGFEDFPENCNTLLARIDEGPDRGAEELVQAEASVVRSGLRAGDEVVLMRIPLPGQDGAESEVSSTYGFSHTHRELPLGAMTLLFVVVVAVVARWRGVRALIGLGLAGAVMWWFVLPALLAGASGLAVAVVGSTLIMYIVLYLAHGLSVRTSTALAGTLLGIAVTALLGLWAIDAARLSGMGEDSSEFLQLYADGLDFRGLFAAAIIIAGLGVLNDVTITQTSAVWELRGAAPAMSRGELFARGMRIGRDHIASTIYTICFAYVGTALGVLLLLSLYQRPWLDVISGDLLGEEIVRTLASAIGLVLAVPITTAIAALTVSGPQEAPREVAEPAASGGDEPQTSLR